MSSLNINSVEPYKLIADGDIEKTETSAFDSSHQSLKLINGKKILLSALMTLLPILANAETVVVDGIRYNLIS